MPNTACFRNPIDPPSPKRSGAVVVLVAVMLIALFGFVALAIDLGYLYLVRTQLQRTADAACMAGAWELLDEVRLRGTDADAFLAARNAALQYSLLNKVANASPVVDLNVANSPDGDVVIGRIDDPDVLSSQMTFGDPSRYNTVLVRVRRTAERNGPVSLFFARVLGIDFASVMAEAAASYRDNVVGFRPSEVIGNASLLPFALRLDHWESLLNNGGPDDYAYDADSGGVSTGNDNIQEVKLYPDWENAGGIEPGNFGTIDIGDTSNSTEDLVRQIVDGVSAADLAYHGGELALDPDTGTLQLNGDTGLSVGVSQGLAEIIGQVRTVPLFTEVVGTGNTAWFTIVGFAGVRVMDFDLTGSPSRKHITVQPAFVIDNTVLIGDLTQSWFVSGPVRLTR